MKKIEINNYIVNNDKGVNARIVLLSDIHYYSKEDLDKLDNLYKCIVKINPKYICIAGDIFEESYVRDTSYFIKWIKALAKDYKVIMILGNHDIMMHGHHKRLVNYPLLAKIKGIDNVNILINDHVIYDNINFIGIDLPYGRFNKSVFYLNYFFKGKKHLVDSDSFNIMLCHSPIDILSNYDTINFLDDIDLSMYGHMHGGLMPNIFRKISNHRGLISPRSGLFPNDCHGYIKNKKAIISTGVTKLSEKNPFHFFNFLYKSEIVIIDIVSKYHI